MAGRTVLPARSATSASVGAARSSDRARASDQARSFGAPTGVGLTSEYSARRTCRVKLRASGSPGKVSTKRDCQGRVEREAGMGWEMVGAVDATEPALRGRSGLGFLCAAGLAG